jgi:hypothetical protein
MKPRKFTAENAEKNKFRFFKSSVNSVVEYYENTER